MSLNFLTWFINWTMSHVIDTTTSLLVSLGSALRRHLAAIELEVGTIDGLRSSELPHTCEFKPRVTLSLRKINELSTGTNIPGLLGHHSCLLDFIDVNSLH